MSTGAQRALLDSILLYVAGALALLLTRAKGFPTPVPLPPNWFYVVYAVLPTMAGLLPLAVNASSRLFRFSLYIVALYFYSLTWFHQLGLIPLLGLGPLDERWIVELTNFIAFWDRPFNWSFLAAVVCLGWLAAGRHAPTPVPARPWR
jgi:hypothetical protein